MERAYRDDCGYHEDRALGLLASATDATPARWRPSRRPAMLDVARGLLLVHHPAARS